LDAISFKQLTKEIKRISINYAESFYSKSGFAKKRTV